MSTRTKICFAGVVVLLGAGIPALASTQPNPNTSPARCGSKDTPEKGIQGDVAPAGGANCGLSFLSQVPGGGSVQGSRHCAYVRVGSVIKTYSLADPTRPRQTDEQSTHGSSESMRAQTVAGRAILVSGKGVWDIRRCEHPVFKGEIPWPSIATYNNGPGGVASTTQHEIAISHDARRVYAGLGFAIAYISDLNRPSTWTVKNNTCEMNRQSGFPVAGLPEATATPCDVAPQGEYPRQYSQVAYWLGSGL